MKEKEKKKEMEKKKRKWFSLFLAVILAFTSLPVSLMAAGNAKSQTQETTKILPGKTSGEINYFSYESCSGKSWTYNDDEAYIDLGSSNEKAEECFYKVMFTGNAIEVFANKSHNHGKVKYRVDDGAETLVDLYESSRTTPQSVYKAENLTEGEHTLYAVTQNERTGSAVVNQVAYVQVTHSPYIAKDFKLEDQGISLSVGQSYAISYSYTPSYATLDDMVYTISDETVALVSDQGMITAKKSGTAVITASSQKAGISRTMEVEVRQPGRALGGTVTDHNTQYTQKRFAEVSVKKNRSETLHAWKNDRAVSELVLSAIGGDFTNVTIQASDLTDGKKKITKDNVTATFIRSTKAYAYGYIYGNDVPAATEDNRAEASDILWQTTPIAIKADTLQPVWVEFAIPKTAKSGTYKTQLTVTADQLTQPLVFDYEVRVQNAELPDNYSDTFDIELWQYPYTSAEYYNVEPFSEEHLEIMKSSMELYKKIGGHAITASIIEDAWNGQTYSANAVHYPSMIKWIKNGDTFTYDYTDFDKWVSFNKSLGIGDKIVLYSVAPWHNSFTYWENGELVREVFYIQPTNGSAYYTENYTTLWTDFLTDLVAHLTEKGWFDDSYIGIDEQGFSSTAFDLIESVKNKDGKCLKTAGAMDSFIEKKNLAMRVTDLNVGDTAAAAHQAEFDQLLKDREAKGLRTTLYSCTGHRPGNFSLSAPVESYWSIVNAGKSGTAGFLRWAYDAWVEDPLNDTTHSKFEPGDCFLIYPDEKTARDPISRSSVRLERMAEGVRDVNKLAVIEKEAPQMKTEIEKLYAGISTTARGNKAFLTDAQIATLSDEMDTFQAGIADLTDQYIKLTGRTEETENESETKTETESETKPTESETAVTEKTDLKPHPDTKESETKQQMPSTETPAKAKPAKVKGLSVKAVSKGKLVLKWKKVRNADGYVVYRADKKKGKYKKVKVLNGARKISFTNKKLKKKKTYYYKVCAYRKVGKKKVYGSYSAVKSRKVK